MFYNLGPKCLGMEKIFKGNKIILCHYPGGGGFGSGGRVLLYCCFTSTVNI